MAFYTENTRFIFIIGVFVMIVNILLNYVSVLDYGKESPTDFFDENEKAYLAKLHAKVGRL